MSSPNSLVPKPGSPVEPSTDPGIYDRPLYQAMTELEEEPGDLCNLLNLRDLL